MTSSRVRFPLIMTVLCTLVVPAVARGQSDDTHTRYGGWRDRVYINAGASFVGHDTFALLQPSGSDIPGVDIERDTQIRVVPEARARIASTPRRRCADLIFASTASAPAVNHVLLSRPRRELPIPATGRHTTIGSETHHHRGGPGGGQGIMRSRRGW